jgi:hypothetical protein
LSHFVRLVLAIRGEVFIYTYNLFEIQFLKIYVQSSDQKVYNISLLQLTVSQRPQRFQDVANLSVEVVKTIQLR